MSKKPLKRAYEVVRKARAAQPSDVIEVWAIDRPRDSESNARTHSKKQIEELRYSFKRYGQVWPILVRPDGEIIAGHGRRIAAKQEGMKTIKVLCAGSGLMMGIMDSCTGLRWRADVDGSMRRHWGGWRALRGASPNVCAAPLRASSRRWSAASRRRGSRGTWRPAPIRSNSRASSLPLFRASG